MSGCKLFCRNTKYKFTFISLILSLFNSFSYCKFHVLLLLLLPFCTSLFLGNSHDTYYVVIPSNILILNWES